MGGRKPAAWGDGDRDNAASSHPSRSLSAFQLALARSRAYRLFGRLFLDGLTEDLLPYVQAIPELAVELPELFDGDQAAADYQHLFGFNVFPYASIFLDPAGLLGGDITEAVFRSYRQAGFQFQESSESADHLGHELDLLAFLCGAEADAWQDALPAMIRPMADLQRDFIDGHLLPWLPPLALALRQQGQPFYVALARLTLDLVTEHRATLSPGPAADFELPEPPDLLLDDQTGLKQIVDYLLAPVYSGLYLGRDDIGRLAKRRALPRGFGNRQQMLLNLLRSAAHYDGLEDILAALRASAAAWVAAYAEMALEPALGPFAGVWQKRAAKTATMLEAMGDDLDRLA